ncbi:hypothetical protein LEMLEM_LOCUS1586 [Lemmus lemmus]
MKLTVDQTYFRKGSLLNIDTGYLTCHLDNLLLFYMEVMFMKEGKCGTVQKIPLLLRHGWVLWNIISRESGFDNMATA